MSQSSLAVLRNAGLKCLASLKEIRSLPRLYGQTGDPSGRTSERFGKLCALVDDLEKSFRAFDAGYRATGGKGAFPRDSIRIAGVNRRHAWEAVQELSGEVLAYANKQLGYYRLCEQMGKDNDDTSCMEEQEGALDRIVWKVKPTADDFEDLEDSLNAEVTESLLDQLVNILTPQGGRIVKFLWGRKHPTAYKTLADECWGNEQEVDTIRTALKRVVRTLNGHLDLGVTIEIQHAKRLVKLNRPPDK